MTPQIPHIPRYFTVKLRAVPPLPAECYPLTVAFVVETLWDYGTFRGTRAFPNSDGNSSRGACHGDDDGQKRTACSGDSGLVHLSEDVGEVFGDLRFLRCYGGRPIDDA